MFVLLQYAAYLITLHFMECLLEGFLASLGLEKSTFALTSEMPCLMSLEMNSMSGFLSTLNELRF